MVAIVGANGGALFLLGPALGGLLTGLLMRRAEPKMSRKQVAIIVFGWVLSWFATALVMAIGSGAMAIQLLGVCVVIIGASLGGAIGSWIMFRQLNSARQAV